MPVLPGTDKIGDWNTTQLTKFVTDWMRNHPLPAVEGFQTTNLDIASRASAPTISDLTSNTTDVATTAFVQAIYGASSLINVKLHGVRGDGTDESSAIHKVDKIAAAAGAVLYFPAGTYVCQALQLKSLSIAGAPGGGTTLKLVSGAGTPAILNGGFNNGTQIGDITFDCQSQANSIGIAVGPTGLTDLSVEACTFINSKYGINGSTASSNYSELSIHRCTFNTGNWGVLFNNVNVSDLQVSHSDFLGGSTGSGLDLNVPSGSLSGVTITGCNFNGYTNTGTFGGFGIDIAGQTSAPSSANIVDVTIQGCTVANCNNDGIHIEGCCLNVAVGLSTIANCGGPGIQIVSLVTSGTPIGNITVVGNTVQGCANTRTTIGSGICVSNATVFHGIIVAANAVRGCGNAGVAGRGINLQAAGQAIVANNLVSNTVGNDATTCGIAVNGSASATPLVEGNRCWDDGPGTQFFGLRVSTTVATIGVNDLSGNVTGRYSWNSGSASGDSILADNGSPAGVIPAAVGCLYRQLNGVAGTALWIKSSGASTSGWQTVQNTGGTSTQTPGAVTTVTIAHGLGVTPTRVNVNAANLNAATAPAMFITLGATNITLNFASALAAATSYSWLWEAGI